MNDLPQSNDELERHILELWRKMLNQPSLSIDDDFFDSGGDSLLATEMLIQLADRIPQSIDVSIIMETGSVRSFVSHLNKLGNSHEHGA